ncbi:hypothetical protein [Thermodesulfovibrio thiophilus]|nr:hypothetical protein [Thermodesulfovibrio thiophilus]
MTTYNNKEEGIQVNKEKLKEIIHYITYLSGKNPESAQNTVVF